MLTNSELADIDTHLANKNELRFGLSFLAQYFLCPHTDVIVTNVSPRNHILSSQKSLTANQKNIYLILTLWETNLAS